MNPAVNPNYTRAEVIRTAEDDCIDIANVDYNNFTTCQ